MRQENILWRLERLGDSQDAPGTREAMRSIGMLNDPDFAEEALSLGVCFVLPPINDELDKINFLANWRSLSKEERKQVNNFVLFHERGPEILKDIIRSLLAYPFRKESVFMLTKDVDEIERSTEFGADTIDAVLSAVPDDRELSNDGSAEDTTVEMQAPNFDYLD